MGPPRAKQLVMLFGCIACASSVAAFYWVRRKRKRRRRASFDFKPQLLFKTILADNSDKPFVHLQVKGRTQPHPFLDEIQYILENPPSCPPTNELMDRSSLDMADQFVWVETRDQLEKLASILSQQHEFAVDVEQHSLRSFRGFVALIQISTRSQDFLIDTLELHDDMFILQKVFADTNICKVFHGADSDSLWLQRDFHIYIVNLFDTTRACDVLGKPQRSLAYLLQTYCGVTTNKVFQRADWRLRPLPEEMVQYARTDVHYLLYIADCLRSELLQVLLPGSTIQQNSENSLSESPSWLLFEECIRRSNSICLQLYEKDAAYTSYTTAAASMLSRININQKIQDDRNLQELRRLVHLLCAWRCTIARFEDESMRFVLSDQAILALATEAPRTLDAICHTIRVADEAINATEECIYMTPIPSPSPVVLQYVDSLIDVFKESAQKSDHGFQEMLDQYVAFLSSKLAKSRSSSTTFLDLSTCMHSLDLSQKVTSASLTDLREVQEVKSRQLAQRDQNVRRRWRTNHAEASRIRFVKKFSCKAPVYHNCRIFAGDGRLLCYCDRKKLDWYVERGLAEFIDENPPAIRLLFEPRGRPEDENNDFYIQSKSNRCVACGESSHYLRYRVIPSCYRQHFPEHLKSHRSHDIVLLCVDCHEKAHRAAEKHKRHVSREFGVPLFARNVVDSGKDAEVLVDETSIGVPPIQLRTAAMALLRHGQTMPKERREQLEQVISKYYGGREITEEDIKTALLVGKGPRDLRRFRKKRGMSLADGLSVAEEKVRTIDEAQNEQVDTGKFLGIEESQKSFRISTFDHQTSDQGVKNSGQSFQDHIFLRDCRYESYAKELATQAAVGIKRTQVSLLGHGPHGKRVVEILLNEEGEEGIRKFCQRWRAVFVEALQPGFLPTGWDILHSGRREFGEFSVYNPERKSNQSS